MPPVAIQAVLDDLLASALRTRLTIFAGAGISYESPTTLPLAKRLTSSIILNLCKDAIGSPETRMPLEFCVEMMRPEIVFSALHQIIGDDAFTPIRFFAGALPNRNHRALAELARYEALAGIITTNFDNAIEQALTDQDVPYRLFVREEEFADWREPTPLPVLKLHGSISGNRHGDDELMVLMEHVGKALPPAKTRSLERFLQTTDMVFVGYSGRDDFDIYPILYRTESDTRLIWVSHPESVPDNPRKREGNEYLTYEQLSAVFANWTAAHERLPNHIDRLVEGHAPRAFHIETDTGTFLTELAHQFTGFDLPEQRPSLRPKLTVWEANVASWAESYHNTPIPYLVHWQIHKASGKLGSPSREVLELALAKARQLRNHEHEKLALRYLSEGHPTNSARRESSKPLAMTDEPRTSARDPAASSAERGAVPGKLANLEATSRQQREPGDVINLPETLLELGLAYSDAGDLAAAVNGLVEAVIVRSKTHEIPRARQRTVEDTPNELRDPIVAHAVAEIVRLLTHSDDWSVVNKALQSLRTVGFDQDLLRYLRPAAKENIRAVADGGPRRLDDSTIERLRLSIEAVCEYETREVPERQYVGLKLQRRRFLSEMVDDPSSPLASQVHRVLDRIGEAKPEASILISAAWIESGIPLRQWLAARWLGRGDSQLDRRLDLLVALAQGSRLALREKAAESLGRLAKSHPNAVLNRTMDLMRHQDLRVRMNAALIIEGVSRRKRKEALELLNVLAADQSKEVSTIASEVKKRLRGSYGRRLIDFIRGN